MDRIRRKHKDNRWFYMCYNIKESIYRKKRCYYCHGIGRLNVSDGIKTFFEDCPICKGRGKVDVIVTIEYKPIEDMVYVQDV